MNWREQNLNLMSSLLHHISRNVQDPEAFKVVFGVFWKDMIHAAGVRNGVPWESEVYFTFALCRDDEVLAAAQPRTFSEQGTMLRLHSWRQDVLRDMGVPLFSDLLTKKKEADGTIKLELKSLDCPPPSGWRLPIICVPPALNELLAAKGMAEDDGSPGHPAFVPTEYGNTLGLCETRWFRKGCGGDTEAASALYASAVGWVDRVRMGERPWEGEPDWTCLPLEVRLERMRDGRAGNPGHCMAALLRMEAMPVAPILSQRINKDYIRQHRPELQKRYGPGVTYGQAARETDRLLCSDSEEERRQGEDRLADLASMFSFEYRLRQGKVAYQTEETIHCTNESAPAGRPLSECLARIGLPENGGFGLPLAGDRLTDIFRGLSRLIGSDVLLWSSYRELVRDIQRNLGEDWDRSFDEVIHKLWNLNDAQIMVLDLGGDPVQIFRLLLLEPFRLLEEVRSLEEKHSGLLEEIQIQNKALKNELERVIYSGSDANV